MSHPGAVVGPKGWAVRPLKWHMSWVQNVDLLRWFVVIQTLVLAYIGEAFRELNWLSMVMPREDLFIVETLMVTTLSWFTKKKKRISLWVQPSGAKVWTRSIHSIKNKETFKNE